MTGDSWFWLSYAVLWAVTVVLGVAVVLMLQDLARKRLVSRQGASEPVLPIGEVWAGLSASTQGGAQVHLPEPGVDQLIVVGSPRCALCREAVIGLGELAREADRSMTYTFVYPGSKEDLELNIGAPPVGVTMVYDVKNDVRRRLGIVTFPYTIAVDSTGRVRSARVAHQLSSFEMLRSDLKAVGYAA